MVRVQRLTGMRPQEVVGLRATDIDMGDPACWVYRPDRHKTEHHDRERIAFIGPRAIEVLRPFITLDISGYLFSPKRSEAERNVQRHAARKTPLYTSHVAHQKAKLKRRSRRPLGDRYSVGTYRQAVHRGCERAGVPLWHPHSLRHSAATEIRGRYGLEGAQAVLGHSELETSQIYAEKSLEAARQIMREIG